MTQVTKPIALNESFRTTEQEPRNIADVLASKLESIREAIESGSGDVEGAFICYYSVTSAQQIYDAIEAGKVPYFYHNGIVAQLWKVETNKYTFRTTSIRVVENENVLDLVDYIVNGVVWSTETKTISGSASGQQAYLGKVTSLEDFDTTGKSGLRSVISVTDVPSDGVYQVSVMMSIRPKTASPTKSDLVFGFYGSDGTGMPNTTFHAVVDDSQTFAQQLSFSTTLNLKAGTNSLKLVCGGFDTQYLVFVDNLTVAQLVNGVYHNGDDFDEVHTLTEALDFNNDDGVLVDGATGGPRFMSKGTLLKQTAQNALAGNVASAFDPSKPNDAGGYAYYVGEVVTYGGKNYRFKANHSSGAWNASQVNAIDESDFFGTQKTTEVFNFVSTGTEIVQFISTIPGELVKLEIDASNWTNNNYPSSGRIFFIDGDSLQLPQIYLGTAIPSEYVFRASSTTTYLHVRGDSGSRMQVKATHYGYLESHKFDGCSQGADLFEMGNISVTPANIGYSNSTSRLRSKKGVYFDAKAGDYIEVTSKTYSIGVGYKYEGDSTWTWSDWKKRFEFKKDGQFVLLARLATEANETFDNLIKSFLVYTQHGSCSDSARIMNNISMIENVDISILTKIRSVSFTANNNAQTINLGQVDDECWLHYDTQEDVDVSGVTDTYAFFVIRLSDGVNGYADVVRLNKPTGATTYSRIKNSVYIPKGYGNLQLYMRASSLTKPYNFWIDKVPPIQVHYPSFGSVKSISHRGGQGRIAARENTTAAMRLAAIYGYKYVETDLHTTSDGYVVCFHDDAIPNLGNIADLTLAQVKTYQPSGFLLDSTIPTLEELLQVCKEYNLHPYLEIKGGGDTTASAAIAIVSDYGMLDNVTWLCFTASYLQTIRTAYAKSRLGLLGGSIDSSLISSAQALHNESNEVFIDVADASNYALAKAENIPVEVWTVSDLPAQHYVSGLTTNKLFPITGKYKGF